MDAVKRTYCFPIEPILWLLIGQSVPSSHRRGKFDSDELVCFLLNRTQVSTESRAILYHDARKVLLNSAKNNPELQQILKLLGELPDIEKSNPDDVTHWLYKRLYLFSAEIAVPISIE
jgi:hypothetical protein